MALRSERELQRIQDEAQRTPIPPGGGRVIDYDSAVAQPCIQFAQDQEAADKAARTRADRENLHIY